MVLKMLKIETCFYIFFDILTQRYWWVCLCVCVCVCFVHHVGGTFGGRGVVVSIHLLAQICIYIYLFVIAVISSFL